MVLTRLKSAALVAVLIGTSSTLAACTSSSKGGTKASSGTLTVSIPLKPQSLDPGKDGDGGQNIVQWLAYEPLIRVKSDGSFTPALATKWGYVGQGNKAFEMTIRGGAKFADGTPVTVKSVVDTINYYLKNPGPLSHYMTGVTAATAKDATTVAITLDKPNPILTTVFSEGPNWGDVISPAGLADPKKLTSQMFGAGPYTMSSAATVEGDHYTFLRNPNYWDKNAIHYNKIVIKVLSDPNAALSALRTGQVQVNLLGGGDLVSQAKSAGIAVSQGPGYVLSTFLMDRAGVVQPALGKLQVRRALNMAVDRAAIAKSLGAGFTPSEQVAPEGNEAFDPALDKVYPYDPAKAKQMLAEAGYPNGFAMTLLSTSLLKIDTVSQAIADQLSKIGVKVTVRSDGLDLNKLIADMASKKYAAVQFTTGTGIFSNALQNWASSASPLNPFASQGTEVTAAFSTLAVASSADSKVAGMALNKAVVDQAWFIPVAQTPAYLFTKGIKDPGTIGNNGVVDILDWRPSS